MPIYEYFCPNCKVKFELLLPMSKATEGGSCPRCGAQGQRLFSRFASFSKDAEGETNPIAGTGSACGTCSATTCSTCGI